MGSSGGTQRIDQTFQMTFHYPVIFTEHLFAPENVSLREVLAPERAGVPSRVLCVVEREVVEHHPRLVAAISAYARSHADALALVAPPLVVEGGEAAKNAPNDVARIQAAVEAHGICRHSYVLAIGGGALLDMAGYAAATAHRGVRLVRVPTTVLAQNDSGVGVKNGINAFGKKNFLGTFAPPYAVIDDAAFLPTLPPRDWRSGLAEAVKVALLKDAAYFAFLEAHAAALMARDLPTMRDVIFRCAQLHLEHIATSGDPFEQGASRPLDFGHWAAHKIEQTSAFRLRHGEAVAIGLALDLTYSAYRGFLPKSDWERALNLLGALGLPRYAPELALALDSPADTRCVLRGLDEFREHLGGELTIMLLRGIGQGIEVHTMDTATLVASITYLASWFGVDDTSTRATPATPDFVPVQDAQERKDHHEPASRHLPAHAGATD